MNCFTFKTLIFGSLLTGGLIYFITIWFIAEYKSRKQVDSNLELTIKNYPIGKKIKYFGEEMTVIKNTKFYPYVGRIACLECRYKSDIGWQVEIIDFAQFSLIESIKDQ